MKKVAIPLAGVTEKRSFKANPMTPREVTMEIPNMTALLKMRN